MSRLEDIGSNVDFGLIRGKFAPKGPKKGGAGFFQAWNEVKTCLLSACDTVCGWTKGSVLIRHETWWWNEEVEECIFKKRKLWKEWQKGGSKEPYVLAKRKGKQAVYLARKAAQDAKFNDLSLNDQKNQLFKQARKMKGENQDIVGDKCVRDDNGNLAIDDQAKLAAWKTHYERLLNVEFDWDSDSLDEQPAVEGPPISITVEMVAKALQKMKKGKATGPSGITVEMIHAAGEGILVAIAHLANQSSMSQSFLKTGTCHTSSTASKVKVMLWTEATSVVLSLLIRF